MVTYNVTGSNSKLMSSEISTYLTGRYILIPVYTLSFKEYLICTLVYGESGEAVTKLLAFVRTTTTGVPIALSCVPGFSGSLLLGW